MNANEFWIIGHQLTKHNVKGSVKLGERRYRGLFGTSPAICSYMWRKLFFNDLHPKGAKPLHLLCGLMLLKSYSTEENYKSITGLYMV